MTIQEIKNDNLRRSAIVVTYLLAPIVLVLTALVHAVYKSLPTILDSLKDSWYDGISLISEVYSTDYLKNTWRGEKDAN